MRYINLTYLLTYLLTLLLQLVRKGPTSQESHTCSLSSVVAHIQLLLTIQQCQNIALQRCCVFTMVYHFKYPIYISNR